MTTDKGRVLCRGIEPSMELGIYSSQVPKTMPLGLLTVMTYAKENLSSKMGFEIVSEDNCQSDLGAPLNPLGRLDHQKLQIKSHAKYLLISVNMTCLIKSAQRVVSIYQNLDNKYQPDRYVYGGFGASDRDEEFIKQNKKAIVLRGEGETAIVELLVALENGKSLDNVPNISYWDGSKVKRNPAKSLKVPQNMMDSLPIPDYGLVKFAKIGIYFVEALQRGCGGKCNFCRVKGKCRYFSTQRSLDRIEDIIRRGGRVIFVVCDHAGEDIERLRELLVGIIRLREAYKIKRLYIVMQVRLTIADHLDILVLAREAGVRVFCIGFESPIAEDLKAMDKPIDPKNMIKQAHTIQKYVAIHYMGIIGYPRSIHGGQPLYNDKNELLSATELVGIHELFIKEVNPDSLQPFIFGPLDKTTDRILLKREDRIYDFDSEYYSGFYVLFRPDEGTDPLELQKEVIRLAKDFYSLGNLWKSFWEFRRRVRDPIRIVIFLHMRWQGRSIARRFRKKYKEDSHYKSKLAAYSMLAKAA